MSRPSRLIIASGIAAWDADVDANFGMIFNKPFAMHQEETEGELNTNFDPADYDQCLVLVGEELYISDGTAWKKYLGVSNHVDDSTASTVSEMVQDFNLLLSKMQDAGQMKDS